MPKFPNELFAEIPLHVDQKEDVVTLLTVSRGFHYGAERALYRKFTSVVPGEDFDSSLSVIRMLESKRLARHVFFFTFHIGAALMDAGFEALMLMRNLKSLDLSCHSPSLLKEHNHFATRLDELSRRAPFSLHRLATNLITINRFIRSQTRLTTLIYTGKVDPPSPALRDFTCIAGTPAVCKLIVPRNRSMRVSLLLGEAGNSHDLSTDETFEQVHVLNVQSSVVRTKKVLRKLARIYPNARYLKFQMICNIAETSVLRSPDQFPHLEMLKVYWKIDRFLSETARSQDSPDLCPSLDDTEAWEELFQMHANSLFARRQTLSCLEMSVLEHPTGQTRMTWRIFRDSNHNIASNRWVQPAPAYPYDDGWEWWTSANGLAR